MFDDKPARHFEDFEIGETWVSAEYVLTEDEIVAFAKMADPQPMHTDPEAAAEGKFGSLIASGWHIAALTMRLFVEAGGYGKTPMLGLGIDELRWKQVARAGDRLTVRREVVELRRSRSRPDRGIVKTRIAVTNQNGEEIMSMFSNGQVPARITD